MPVSETSELPASKNFHLAAFETSSCSSLNSPVSLLLPPAQSFTSPTSDRLLPDLLPNERGIYTLVLDLEGTLVQSEWRVSAEEAVPLLPALDEHGALLYTQAHCIIQYTLVLDLEGTLVQSEWRVSTEETVQYSAVDCTTAVYSSV